MLHLLTYPKRAVLSKRIQYKRKMPNRMLRDWTDSDKMKGVTAHGERFFTRLIMKVDDYGCLYADSSLLKAALFPFLLDEVREADVSRWTTECQKAGLIVLYESAGKKYLHILDFRQRLDKAKNKYPLPTSGNALTTVTDFRAEAEEETEQKKKGETRAPADLTKSNLFRKPNMPTWDLVRGSFGQFGGTEEMAKSFFDRHEATGWFLNGSPITNWSSLVGKWIRSWRKNEEVKKLNGNAPKTSVGEQVRAAREKHNQ